MTKSTYLVLERDYSSFKTLNFYVLHSLQKFRKLVHKKIINAETGTRQNCSQFLFTSDLQTETSKEILKYKTIYLFEG